MSEQLDLTTFAGAHPTNEEFVQQLRAWSFTQRRIDGVHLVFRGPHGGTVRVLRSLLGRPDASLVAKAARLAQVDVERFWAGPDQPSGAADQPAEVSPPPTQPHRRRAPATRDRIVSMVLAAHTSADRPLGFEQVVQLCRGRITREQVQTASATLCRDGDLDRIRPGVYQWSGGVRATPVTTPAPTRPATPAGTRPGPRPSQPSASGSAPTGQRGHPTAAELFDRLFPDGVRMNAELLADFDRWARLTDKFVAACSEPS